MLIPILIALTVIFWVGYFLIYFWREIYVWFDNRWGPPSRKEKKPKLRRRFYE